MTDTPTTDLTLEAARCNWANNELTHKLLESRDFEEARAEALDAKLKEAVELLNKPVATHKDPEWRHARSAFLASLEGDKP